MALIPRMSILACVSAEMLIGTLLITSARRVAVTTTCPSWPVSVPVVSVLAGLAVAVVFVAAPCCCAKTGAASRAPAIAA